MEFLAIIIDVGSLMFDDGDISSIDIGINIIKTLITKKLFSKSKDEIAVILCGSHDTNNALYYKNIYILKELAKVNWTYLDCLNKRDERHCCDNGDLLNAIVVASDHLVKNLRGRNVKGSKRVMVISNLERNINFSQLAQIVEGLNKEEIELNIISNKEFQINYPDSKDDPSTSDGPKNAHVGMKLSDNRMKNERELSKMISQLNGSIYSFDDVQLSLNIFETKSTKPMGWKVNLEISNICQLSIVGYVNIKQAKPQNLTLCYGGDPAAEVEKRPSHHLNDCNNTTVDAADTIKGYKYGNSLVPCTEEDIASMGLTVEKGLKLIGFCDEDNVSRDLYIGNSSMIFIVNSSSSANAFESLVQSMYECGVVALVRRVYNCNSAPRLAVLTPIIKKKSVSLAYCEIAFGEDIRSYTFPSLPGRFSKDDTLFPKNINKTSLSEKQLNAVDSLIDNMMLIKKDEDDDKEKELYKPSEIVSPFIQMFYQSVTHRLSHPNERLPELNEQVMSTLQPPEENNESINDCIDAIKTYFLLKEREKRKKAESEAICQKNGSGKICKMETEEQKPMASGDIITTSAHILSCVSNIEDFLELLKRGQISLAIGGMQNLISELINRSYLDTLYSQAILSLIELRSRVLEYSSMDLDLISQFNQLLQTMKSSILSSLSKGNFCTRLKKENLTLTGLSESEFGCQDFDEESFLDTKVDSVVPAEQNVEDMDTLYDDM